MDRVEKALLFLFLLIVGGLGVSRIISWDLFWQLQSGRYVLATHNFIHQDLFTLASQAPRYEHCWLHDVIFFLIYSLAGFSAISVLKGILVALTGLVIIAVARQRGASYSAILLLSLPFFLKLGPDWLARPQLWSYFLFAIFLLVWENFRQGGGHRIWFLLPLMVLWANLHAAAILAFPVAVAWVVGEGADRFLARSRLNAADYRRLCLVAVLLVLVSLITPYHLQILRTFLAAPGYGQGSGSFGQIHNLDWRAASLARSPAYYVLLVEAILLLVGGRRHLVMADLLLFGGLGFMGLKLERHQPFLVIALAALAPIYLDATFSPLVAKLKDHWRFQGRIAILFLAIGLFAIAARPLFQTMGFWETGLREHRYPVGATDFLRENRLPGNLFNSYGWGGYLMWRLYPAYRVFWDGRQDSPAMFRKGMAVLSGQHWREIFNQQRVNTVILQPLPDYNGGHYRIIDVLGSSPDWALAYADVSALVFVRRASVPRGWLVTHEKDKSEIDDTLLSAAKIVTKTYPWRYMVWWEISLVTMKKGHYRESFEALKKYLDQVPVGKKDPRAKGYYRLLSSKIKL